MGGKGCPQGGEGSARERERPQDRQMGKEHVGVTDLCMPVSAKVRERQEWGSKRGSVTVSFGGKVRGHQDE